MTNVAGFLAPTINKALLANGVQLTAKELTPVSREVAEYVFANEDAFNEALKADKKVVADAKAKEIAVPTPSGKPPAPPPPPEPPSTV
jgi:hypothetical protein